LNSLACKQPHPLLKTGHHAALGAGKMVSKEIWPNFFIVGAARAGTTSLYQYLRRVSGIYMSALKEPRYFCADRELELSAPAPIRSQRKYLRLVADAKNATVVGEASPQYLCDPDAPRLIHEAVPDARILMSLRDPVERTFSHYLLHRRMGVQSLPAREALRRDFYLREGRYARPVQRYRELFGSERVKVLIFEEFVHDARKGVNDVLAFLGIDAEPPDSVGEIHNAFAKPRGLLAALIYQNNSLRAAARALFSDRLRRSARERILLKQTDKPALPDETRRFLQEMYRDDVLNLEQILGRPLPWFHRIDPSA
jgi:hypothetical protein